MCFVENSKVAVNNDFPRQFRRRKIVSKLSGESLSVKLSSRVSRHPLCVRLYVKENEEKKNKITNFLLYKRWADSAKHAAQAG